MKLSYVIKYIFNTSLRNIYTYRTLSSEYLPWPSALGNIPTLGSIYIDVPHERVEYLYYIACCQDIVKFYRDLYFGYSPGIVAASAL